MLQEFKSFVKTMSLFNDKDRILLAVSGGVDSVVMVDLFSKAKIKFGIAHCNFHLREEDSNNDERFVKQLAEKYNVAFHGKSFDTLKFVENQGVSVQMAARDLRYQWFKELLGDADYNYLATAHHLDDQAETFFINILRATGIAGLHGIAPKMDKVIRPLLFATREQIADYARENNIVWREDRTNASDKYLRNNIRHHILPAFYRLNPDFSRTLNETILFLRGAEHVYIDKIKEVEKEVVSLQGDEIIISLEKIERLSHVDVYLFEILRKYNFTASQVKDIVKSLSGLTGKAFYSSTHILLKDRESLIIKKNNKSGASTIKEEFLVFQDDERLDTPLSLKISITDDVKNLYLRDKNTACLDFGKLSFPLVLRKWEQGDWFIPYGSKGKKKLSDFFIDNKFTQFEKESTWLLVSEGNIVWIAGYRTDERFKIDQDTTLAFVISKQAVC